MKLIDYNQAFASTFFLFLHNLRYDVYVATKPSSEREWKLPDGLSYGAMNSTMSILCDEVRVAGYSDPSLYTKSSDICESPSRT